MTRNIAAVRTPKKQKFSIIIPAAGEGTRMKSYGPKSLIKLCDDYTLIENQLYFINKTFKQCEIILVAGFEAKRVIEKTPSNIIKVVNKNYNETNVIKSIGLGLKRATTDNILVVYGDLVFNQFTLKAPLGIDSALLIDPSGLMGNDEVGCIIQNRMVQQVMYDLPNKWAQISYFTGKEAEMLRHFCNNPHFEMYFGFEIINMILNQGGTFTTYSHKKMMVTDVDSSKDIEKARFIYENSINSIRP